MSGSLPRIYGPAPYVATGLTATGSTQAQAFGLTAQINVFSTVAASSGAILPSVPGQLTVVNNGANALSLYPGLGDQIGNNATNSAITVGVSTQVNVAMLTNSAVAAPPRTWQLVVDSLNSGGTIAGNLTVTGTIEQPLIQGGTQTSIYQTQTSQDAISTAGSTQAQATQLTGMVANVSTTTLGQGINLLAEQPGLTEIIINSGTSGFTAYAAQGETTTTINGLPGTTGVLVPAGAVVLATSTKAGAVEMAGIGMKQYGSIANAASAATTLAASALTTGSFLSFVQMTGSIGAGAALTLPTAPAWIADLPFSNLNTGNVLRIGNSGAGTGAWTLTASANFAVAGSVSIGQNTWYDYGLIVNNSTSATAQYLGHGTY